jgi:photosystem II stability/assembly factor-like uncharacterized protein
MAGRIDDIEAVESNPYIFYVGFATGGVWKTVNNGTTFEPIFDIYPTISVGDIAIYQPNPDIIWVGTGEANNRQSSSYGAGIYKSTDAGKTFTCMGLNETQSIARIVTDPKDPNIVYVAVLGHLFGPNKERGIYKTTDGGRTWTNIKFIDEDTGFTDIVMDPSDNRTLYAASYQRRRTSWGFNGGGPGSGIWKTTDAGKTWTKLAGGLPGPELGRIGLDVSRSNPNIVYAQIEVRKGMGTGTPPEPPLGQPLNAPVQAAGRGGAGGGGGGGRGGQAAGNPDPTRDGVWRSDDKGKTWRFLSNADDRAMYYSQIRVDPSNSEIVYSGGAPFFKSTDGGKTFTQVQGIIHTDNHAIWIDPKNGNHLIIGNDGGLDITYDQCATWEFVNTIAVGQFYAVAADMRKPYYVYGGLQDNGSWGGPSANRGGRGGGGGGITNAEWFSVGGGDGFYCQVDPTDYNTIYTESQNGSMSRYDLKTGRTTSIQPRTARGRGGMGGAPAANTELTPEQQAQQQAIAAQMAAAGFGGQPNIVPPLPADELLRWYWNTPIALSPHNPQTIYTGANRFFKSTNRGDTWMAGPDLTKQIDRRTLPIMGVPGDKDMFSKHDGFMYFGHIVTLAESAAQPGILWVGTDDGNVQVSRDGGYTWKNVADNIPGLPKISVPGISSNLYHVTRVAPSHFDAATCYVTLDGHRFDDLKPYVYVTRDFGATWTSIVNNLPQDAHVNVILEDPKNKSLLYLGSELGFYISLNGGAEWKRFMNGLPTVPIDDVIVHPRDNDLILGTHGRSIWIMDDISALQQLTDKAMAEDVHLMDPRPSTNFSTDIYRGVQMARDKNFRGQNPAAGTVISYYLKSPASGDVKISILDVEGKVVQDITGSKDHGLHRVQWSGRGSVPAGGRGGSGARGAGAPAAAAQAGGAQAAAGGGAAAGAAAGAQGAGAAGGAAAGAQGAGAGAGGAAQGAAAQGAAAAQFAGGFGGGGRGGFGAALDPGVYRVKLTVGDKEYFTKVVVEEDPNIK